MLAKLLSPHEAKAYALLRIVSGACFVMAGLPKIVPVLAGFPMPPVGSQLWLGGVIEIVAGLLVTVGLFTAMASFVASGQMAVAYIQFHWMFQLDANLLPTVNQGLGALLLCFIFLFIACRGSGIWSVDSARR